MMEIIERNLKLTGDPHDLERAEMIRIMRKSRGLDIELPGDSVLVYKNIELEEEVRRLRDSLGRRSIEPTVFGTQLKLLRTGLGMTQKQFGKPVPIDQTMVSRLEGGGRPVKEETLHAICAAHRLTPDEVRRLYGAAGFTGAPISLLP